MKKMLLIIGVLLVLAGAVTGQTLTVEQYRAKVLEYNQDIKQAVSYTHLTLPTTPYV